MLTSKSLASCKEKQAPEYNVSRDRIMPKVCCMQAEHPLPQLVIRKSTQMWVAFLVTQITSHKRAWMTSDIFLYWFSNIFIPSEKLMRKRRENTEKIILLIDNVPYIQCDWVQPYTDTYIELLNKVNENFTMMFLPLNIDNPPQMMDQGIIVKYKKHTGNTYLQLLLVLLIKTRDSVITLSKKLNVRDSCYMFVYSWVALHKKI